MGAVRLMAASEIRRLFLGPFFPASLLRPTFVPVIPAIDRLRFQAVHSRDAGEACAAYHDEHVRGVASRRVQCDEIWSFVYAKQKNVAAMKTPVDGAGDTWTWTAIDADSKLIVSYMLGQRGAETANAFMQDVAARPR